MDCGGVASPMYRLGVALVLVATIVLAGCGSDRSPAPAPPTGTVRSPAPSPTTTLVSSLPRLLRIVDGYHMFEVSPQQYEIIGRHVHQVIVRERLYDQGVRFGANHDPDKHRYFVLINPGFSQLSARQILDRLLGII
jgi:hypothetical protein